MLYLFQVIARKLSIVSMIFMLLAVPAVAEENDENPTLTPEDWEQYEFPEQEDTFEVRELSSGQVQVLARKRLLARDLMARKLGILSIKGNKSDLAPIQQLIDKRILRPDQVDKWQALGVLFGDIIVREFGLRWVVFEDNLGVSKALRWGSTENFVFPLTIFSKRVKYGEVIDVEDIYHQLSLKIEAFKRWELRPQLPNSRKSS